MAILDASDSRSRQLKVLSPRGTIMSTEFRPGRGFAALMKSRVFRTTASDNHVQFLNDNTDSDLRDSLMTKFARGGQDRPPRLSQVSGPCT